MGIFEGYSYFPFSRVGSFVDKDFVSLLNCYLSDLFTIGEQPDSLWLEIIPYSAVM